jgi:hypothetical protein
MIYIQVNTFIMSDKPVPFAARTVLADLRAAIANIGKEVLGFEAHEIGLHPLWSGAEMAMYLNNITVYMIMLIG